jgi:hypothetical protein
MRITLTLDPDVARMLEAEAHRQRKPFRQVLNDTIRRGLAPSGRTASGRYQVEPHKTTLRAGIDSHALNRLADELEE